MNVTVHSRGFDHDLHAVSDATTEDRFAQRRRGRDHGHEAITIGHGQLDACTHGREEDRATLVAILDLDDRAERDAPGRMQRTKGFDHGQVVVGRAGAPALRVGERRELERHARIGSLLVGGRAVARLAGGGLVLAHGDLGRLTNARRELRDHELLVHGSI